MRIAFLLFIPGGIRFDQNNDVGKRAICWRRCSCRPYTTQKGRTMSKSTECDMDEHSGMREHAIGLIEKTIKSCT